MVKKGTRSIEGAITEIKEIINSLPAGMNKLGAVQIKDTGDVTIDPAKEAGNLASILAQLDITLSALRDAMKGAGAKDFSTLETELAKRVGEATTPTIYNVTLTSANTEYSQALPAGTKRFSVHLRENDVAYRVAFETGKVATPTEPYETVPLGIEYYETNLNLTDKTIYIACGTAGKHAEIIVWM